MPQYMSKHERKKMEEEFRDKRPFDPFPTILFQEPEDNQTVWRYIDIMDFFAILERRTLFFSQVRTLADRNEGNISFPFREALEQKTQHRGDSLDVHLVVNEIFTEDIQRESERMRSQIAVSCWHQNVGETITFWERHGKMRSSIAIRNTYAGLMQSLHIPDRYTYVCSRVFYDPLAFSGVVGSQYNHFFYKNSAYANENEFRILIYDVADDARELNGVEIPVDVEQLLGGVVFSPCFPVWQMNLVKSIAANRYGLSPDIFQKSKLVTNCS